MNKVKQLLILILLSLSIGLKSNAQTISGAEIYYNKISTNKFLITAQVYRPCNGNPLYTLNGFVIADTFKIAINFKRTYIQKINDTCGNPCNIQNTKSNVGFERHTFTDTIDFNKSPYDSIVKAGLCLLKFAIYHYRSSAISTHYPGNQVFYLDAQLNICNNSKSINSPIFSYDPKFNSACNQPMFYNPGPIDTLDYDSLSFELDIPAMDVNKLINYTGNFTKTIPLTPYCPPSPGIINCRALPSANPPRGFYFDSSLCQIVVTPAVCSEIASFKFKVKEWRRDSNGNYQYLGYISREFTINIIAMPDNIPPLYSGITKNFACNGSPICFTSTIKDLPFLPKQTTYDTVYWNWNHGITGANFQILNPTDREKTTQFCWTPKKNIPKHRFVFATAAWDKNCNSNIAQNGYYIQNYPLTEFNKKTSINACNLIYMNAWEKGNNKLYGTIDILDQNNKNIFHSTRNIDSFTINRNGTFYVFYKFTNLSNNFCLNTLIDTIQISNALYKGFETPTEDSNVCETFPAKLIFSPSSYKQNIYWNWYRNDTFLNNTDTAIFEVITKPSKYKLVLIDQKNCTATTLRNFNPYKNPSKLFYGNVYTCPQIEVNLTPNLSNLKPPLLKKWIFRSQTISADTLRFQPQHGEKISLHITDDNHCNVIDSLSYLLFPPVEFSLSNDSSMICKDSTVEIKTKNLKAVNPYNTYWKVNYIDSALLTNNTSIKFKITGNSTVNLEIIDNNKCKHSDSIKIKNLGHPKIQIDHNGGYCSGDSLWFKARIFNYNGPSTLEWKINQTVLKEKDSVLVIQSSKSFNISLLLKDLYQCSTQTSKNINLYDLPEFSISGDTFYNRFALVKLSTNQTFNSYQWSNGSLSQQNNFWASSLGGPGDYKIWCKVIDSNNCSNIQFKHIKTIDLPSDLYQLSNSIVKIFPNPFKNYLIIESNQNEKLTIYNNIGQIVFESDLKKGSNKLELREIVKGIYFIKIGDFSTSLIKE